MNRVDAPFTPEQVESLNAYQHAGIFHEFTCGGKHEAGVVLGPGLVFEPAVLLVATVDGWVCSQSCGYTQTWAHSFMADDTWRSLG